MRSRLANIIDSILLKLGFAYLAESVDETCSKMMLGNKTGSLSSPQKISI